MVKYASHSATQGPRPVPSVAQDEFPPIVPPPPGAVLVLDTDLSKIKLISAISQEDIPKHMHHPGNTFPEVPPCDTPAVM